MTETSPPPPKVTRRFAPVPVEETRSSRKQNEMADTKEKTDRQDFAVPKKRFLPTPVETTRSSNKQLANAAPPTPEHASGATSIPRTPPEVTTKPRRPRFAPQLIESSKRSKKAGDLAPATLPTDKVRISSMFHSTARGISAIRFEEAQSKTGSA
jgi:hypothetical protein